MDDRLGKLKAGFVMLMVFVMMGICGSIERGIVPFPF